MNRFKFINMSLLVNRLNFIKDEGMLPPIRYRIGTEYMRAEHSWWRLHDYQIGSAHDYQIGSAAGAWL